MCVKSLSWNWQERTGLKIKEEIWGFGGINEFTGPLAQAALWVTDALFNNLTRNTANYPMFSPLTYCSEGRHKRCLVSLLAVRCSLGDPRGPVYICCRSSLTLSPSFEALPKKLNDIIPLLKLHCDVITLNRTKRPILVLKSDSYVAEFSKNVPCMFLKLHQTDYFTFICLFPSSFINLATVHIRFISLFEYPWKRFSNYVSCACISRGHWDLGVWERELDCVLSAM